MKIRSQQYKETYDELVKKQISNSENHDKSILTLSASGLGISLAFIKDIAPLAKAHDQNLLVISWFLFGIAIVTTITSFMTSQAAIRFQIDAAHRYYIENQKEYLDKNCFSSLATNWLNHASGIAFISAVTLTIIFVAVNLPFSTQ